MSMPPKSKSANAAASATGHAVAPPQLFVPTQQQQQQQQQQEKNPLRPPPPANKKFLSPQEVNAEVDRLHFALLDTMTRAQDKSSQLFKKLQHERETTLVRLQTMEFTQQQLWSLWSSLLEHRMRLVLNQEKAWAKIESLIMVQDRFRAAASSVVVSRSVSPLTTTTMTTPSSAAVAAHRNGSGDLLHRERDEEQAQRRLLQQQQHEQQHQLELQNERRRSQLFAFLLRLQLDESEARREIESRAQQIIFEFACRASAGYSHVWQRFAAKMDKEMRRLDLICAA